VPWLWTLLAVFCSLATISLGLYTGTALLRRRLREVEYGLADLEDRLIREVKKRAALARWETEPEPAALKEELKANVASLLSPAEFVRRKWQGRGRGPEDRKVSGEGS